MCHPVYPGLPLQLPSDPAFLPHPWPPQPMAQWIPTQHLGSHPTAPVIHVQTTPTSGLSTFPNPPHQGTIISSTKRTQLCHHPQIPPIEAYITAIEQASSKLPAQEADEFRSEVNKILKQQHQQHNNHCNLNPSQHKALTQLKQDNSRVVLTVEKGVAMVIMDHEDYTNKAQALLLDTNTYKVLTKNPTSQLKNKLISLLKGIKQTGGLTTHKYKQLYPTSAVPQNSMACPKFTKQVHPSGPLFPVGGPSHMVLPRSYHTSSNPL